MRFITGFLMAALATACGPSNASDTPAQTPQTPSATQAPPAPPIELPAFELATAALRATISSGIDSDIPRYVRTIPGVAAAARIGLSNLTVDIKQTSSELSIMTVDPVDFRPLAPSTTAEAEFVWKGLINGELFLAHEEQRRLDPPLGSVIYPHTPSGIKAMRVGGVAANATPNLAGGMISTAKASALGIGEPTVLLVGLRPKAKVNEVLKALGGLLIGVKFEKIKPARTFLSGTAAERAIGTFEYTPNEDGTLNQDPEWVRKNIVSFQVPILGSMKCHRVMRPQLSQALAEIESSGLAPLIDTKQFGGCYVPRFIARDQTRPISMHGWGLAIDINVSTNLQGAEPQLDPRIVHIFERWGFRWGGHWSVPDGMHFELAALLKT